MTWYVFTVAPRMEKRAQEELSKNGYRSKVPLWWQKRQGRKGDIEEVPTPLIPGYVFAEVKHWPDAMKVREIRGVIKIDGEPAVLTEADLIWLRANHRCKPESGGASLDIGTIVSVLQQESPILAIVEDSLKVEVEMFGSRREMWVPARVVEKVT